MSTRDFTSATPTRVLGPTEWVAKQMKSVQTVAKSNYLIGIAHPKKDPIAAGSTPESEATYNASMQIALAEERRMKGVGASSIQEWYTYSKEIGADKLVSGILKREAKVSDFVRTWHPILEGHLAKIDDLSGATLEDRITKMAENARGLSALKGASKGY